MSAQPKDGGPALPIKGFCADASGAFCGEVVNASGMTLRDYFAAKAMAAVYTQHWDWNEKDIAGRAYVIANAMLVARNQVQP